MDLFEIKDKILLNSTSRNNDTVHLSNSDVFSFADNLSKINFGIIVSFGIWGNVCCSYVYSQKLMRKRKFNWYLLILAIFNTLFCFIISIDYSYRLFSEKSIFLHDFNVYTNMLIDYLIHLIDSYVTVLTLILSFDRLNAIKNLTNQRNFVTHRHAKFLIFITFLSILVLKIPFLILCYENTERYFNVISCTIISPLFFNIIPTIAIFVVNSILVARLIKFYQKLFQDRIRMLAKRKRSRRMSELDLKACKRNSSETIEVNVCRISQQPLCRTQKAQFVVILVVAMWSVFVTLLYYPLLMFHLYLHRVNIFIYLENFTKTQIISSTFFNLNHCIHFFIYFFFNFEFRKSVCKLLKKD